MNNQERNNPLICLTPSNGSAPGSRRAKLSFSGLQWLAVALLMGIPFLLAAYKLSDLLGAAWLSEVVSFEHLSHEMRSRTRHVLFTPLGALVVVLFRLTLGLRVLGPFRSVLLAVAFQVTGIAVGLGFFSLVIGVVVLLRPRLKDLKLPYFGRSTAMLVAVASMIIATMLVGQLLGVPEILHAGFFPVVVLTLAGEAFAGTLRKEGARSALWRAGATSLAAVIITLISQVSVLQSVLLRFPEFTLCFLAGVILTSRFLAFRWLGWLNPAPLKKNKKNTKALLAADSGQGVAHTQPLGTVGSEVPDSSGVAGAPVAPR